MEGHALCGDNHRYQSTRLQETVNLRDPDFALVGMDAVGGLYWLHYMQMLVSLSCQNPNVIIQLTTGSCACVCALGVLTVSSFL